MKKDLAEIKSILQRALKGRMPEKSTGTVGVAGGVVLGEIDAAVTIVEFSDYQCPFCRRYSLTVFPIPKREYIDTGTVRDVFRDFPLTSIHQQAEKAPESAHCAAEFNTYWEMYDALFEKQTASSLNSCLNFLRFSRMHLRNHWETFLRVFRKSDEDQSWKMLSEDFEQGKWRRRTFPF